MSDSVQKFYLDDSFGEKKEEKTTEKVLDMLKLFRELSVEEKLNFRRLVSLEKIL